MVTDKKQKTYQNVDAVVFLETAEALRLDYGALSEQLGYTRSAGNHWVACGRMPKVASIACEALRKRLGTPGDVIGKALIIVYVENGRAVAHRTIDAANLAEAKVGQQSYHLIPKGGAA